MIVAPIFFSRVNRPLLTKMQPNDLANWDPADEALPSTLAEFVLDKAPASFCLTSVEEIYSDLQNNHFDVSGVSCESHCSYSNYFDKEHHNVIDQETIISRLRSEKEIGKMIIKDPSLLKLPDNNTFSRNGKADETVHLFIDSSNIVVKEEITDSDTCLYSEIKTIVDNVASLPSNVHSLAPELPSPPYSLHNWREQDGITTIDCASAISQHRTILKQESRNKNLCCMNQTTSANINSTENDTNLLLEATQMSMPIELFNSSQVNHSLCTEQIGYDVDKQYRPVLANIANVRQTKANSSKQLGTRPNVAVLKMSKNAVAVTVST